MDIEFKNILDWITGIEGGAFVIVSFALSWAFEGAQWWQNLTSKARSMIILGSALVMGLGTVWLQSQPDIVDAVQPYAQVVIYVVAAWLATQVAHKVDPTRTELAIEEMLADDEGEESDG